jgi:uncharacterized protein
MIYIDTSAVLKLVHPGAESGALRTWLASHSDDLVSSALVRTEARCALLRNDPEALPGLSAILAVIAQIPVSEAVLDSAAMFPEPLLRSLDANHLASAQSITAVTAVLAGAGADASEGF